MLTRSSSERRASAGSTPAVTGTRRTAGESASLARPTKVGTGTGTGRSGATRGSTASSRATSGTAIARRGKRKAHRSSTSHTALSHPSPRAARSSRRARETALRSGSATSASSTSTSASHSGIARTYPANRPAALCEAPPVHWQLVALAVVLLGFAAISRRIEGTWITAPMVFTAAGLVVGVEALDLVDPAATGLEVKTLAEATLTVVLFSDASRIDLQALRSAARHSGAAARDRAAAHDRRRVRRRNRAPRRPRVARSSRARDHPRAHRCRARPGRRHVAAPPCPSPSEPQRRERPQRRDLRAALPHRARRRAGGGGRDRERPRRPARAREDRIRRAGRCRSRARLPPRSSCTPAAGASSTRPWLQVVPLAGALLAFGVGRGDRRLRVHRRVRRRRRSSAACGDIAAATSPTSWSRRAPSSRP